MPSTRLVYFPPFRLDLDDERLWCGDAPLRLTHKAFAVLRTLLETPGQLVTKDAIFAAVWAQTAVSESALTFCIRELRRVLHDTVQEPQYIETVRGRGYRFVAPVTRTAPVGQPPRALRSVALSPPQLVGRDTDLAWLQTRYARVLQGEQQFVCVTGEAGLGKTTLVQAFLAGLSDQDVWIGRGQCLEHYGPGEAYLPLLEALGQLGREPGGHRVVEHLEQWAPTWLSYLPGLLRLADREALQRRVEEGSQNRMLRELTAAVVALSAVRPLVLVLEDLHWSDYATVDVLAALARQQEPARLLVLGTYRPAEVTQHDHPLRTVTHELVLHGQCAVWPLALLSDTAVAAFLTAHFAGGQCPAGLARVVYERTEGNPLFMAAMLQDWLAQGWLAQTDTGVRLQVGLAELRAQLPESLRQLLEAQLDRLSPAEQHVLEAGSVAGVEFSAAAVAAGLALDVLQSEAYCVGLVRRSPWLQATQDQIWPDGTVAGGYRFAHALYQEVAYSRVPAARRVHLHRRIGERLEAGYGLQGSAIAAELALHFAWGQDTPRAVGYLQQAADNALRRSAHASAITHLTNALLLLARLPATPEHLQHALALQATLGSAMMAVKGFTAPEVAHAYARAQELCQQVGETSQLFEVLRGLCVFAQERAEVSTAYELAQQLFRLAQRLPDAIHLLWAHNMLGYTLFLMSELVPARGHLEASLVLYQLHTPQPAGFVFDPGVDTLCILAEVLFFLGYADQALARTQEGLRLARELAHSFSLALALQYVARMHRRRGELTAARAFEQESLELCRTHEFVQGRAEVMVWQGWDLLEQGQGAGGIAQMCQGLEALRALGAEDDCQGVVRLLATAYGRVGQAATGLRLLTEVLATVDTTGKRIDAAELYRSQGDLLLRQRHTAGRRHVARAEALEAEAEACFHRALVLARGQQAKTLELRAALSLSHLWQQQGKGIAARALLAPLYGWFSEGFATADLREARGLLEALPG